VSPARRRRYSFIRHLAWSVLLNHDPEKCIVSVFAPYEFMAAYDASGSENDRGGTLVVVALAATEVKWDKFHVLWQAVLDQFGVPYLHMKELNHRHTGKGIYAKWRDDYDTPRLFLKSLVKAVKLGINKTFCYGTILNDYRDVNKEYKLREGGGSPYVITAGSCYDLVNDWMKTKHPKKRTLHVFEKGDCGQRDLERLARRHDQFVIPVPKIDPVTGDRWIPFQAADLLAGAWRDAAGKHAGGKVRRMEDYGDVFNDVAFTLPRKSLIYHAKNLRAICDGDPERYPKR
jgi:hypothetical protein